MDKAEEKKADFGQNMEHQDFFQSQEWRNFQEAFGRKAHLVKQDNFCASIIEHTLPIVGKYFYIPRGPVTSTKVEEGSISNNQPACRTGRFSNKSQNSNINDQIEYGMRELVDLAKKENAGWIRIEPSDLHLLDLIRSSSRVAKAPYDVQPKEIFVVDISKPEQQLLAEMKSKTRYNIGVAKKRGVSLRTTNSKDIKEFLKLTKEMAARQGIVPHPDAYYEKMFETFPEGMLKLYIAEYNGNVISANLMLFFGNTATYLHGASSNANRNVMAPFLLQWQAILDAKERGCKWYDLGGVQTEATKHKKHSDLSGVTAFKIGFSSNTEPVVFPGTYDIIVNPRQYALYKGLQKAKMFLKKFRR